MKHIILVFILLSVTARSCGQPTDPGNLYNWSCSNKYCKKTEVLIAMWSLHLIENHL